MIFRVGGHTIGDAHCAAFRARLYNFSGTGQPDPTLSTEYLVQLQSICPSTNPDPNTLTDFDLTTPDTFDNKYYTNLINNEGLLQSDQELYSTDSSVNGATDAIALVKTYSANNNAFLHAFARSMINIGNISPLTGNEGEIRLNCRKVNNS